MRKSMHNISRILVAICMLSIACLVFTDIAAASSCTQQEDELKELSSYYWQQNRELNELQNAGLSGYLNVGTAASPPRATTARGPDGQRILSDYC